MSNLYKSGSKLATVYDVFLSSGIEAAFAKGIEIGLAASTLKIQVKRKNWGGGTVSVPTDSANSKKAAAASAANSRKPRFLMSKKGKREMVVLSEGAEQSIVRFLDTGEEQCVVNSWLVPVKG